MAVIKALKASEKLRSNTSSKKAKAEGDGKKKKKTTQEKMVRQLKVLAYIGCPGLVLNGFKDLNDAKNYFELKTDTVTVYYGTTFYPYQSINMMISGFAMALMLAM